MARQSAQLFSALLILATISLHAAKPPPRNPSPPLKGRPAERAEQLIDAIVASTPPGLVERERVQQVRDLLAPVLGLALNAGLMHDPIHVTRIFIDEAPGDEAYLTIDLWSAETVQRVFRFPLARLHRDAPFEHKPPFQLTLWIEPKSHQLGARSTTDEVVLHVSTNGDTRTTEVMITKDKDVLLDFFGLNMLPTFPLWLQYEVERGVSFPEFQTGNYATPPVFEGCAHLVKLKAE